MKGQFLGRTNSSQELCRDERKHGKLKMKKNHQQIKPLSIQKEELTQMQYFNKNSL